MTSCQTFWTDTAKNKQNKQERENDQLKKTMYCCKGIWRWADYIVQCCERGSPGKTQSTGAILETQKGQRICELFLERIGIDCKTQRDEQGCTEWNKPS